MTQFDQYLIWIKERKPFTFSRFGDGEFSAILQRPGKNCDGHDYFPEMGAALATVLRSRPTYQVGIQNHALRTIPELPVWLQHNDLEVGDFVNADVWHHASIKEQFDPFFEAIQNRPVLLVGPHNLTKMGIHSYWVEVPERNCWNSFDAIMRGIDNYIDHADIVLFSASMPAKIMIDQLHARCGETKTLLDMGSVFMPYVGIANRSYHKKILERLNGGKQRVSS
jgi:hypothetical protein